MKKVITIVLVLALALAIAFPVQAAKPSANLAAALKIDWYLSAAVAKVPPYGSLDIPGSDIASKLIVNQPNGNTEVTITGAMNGLHPNTQYTVYLSNDYSRDIPRWSLEGNWTLSFMFSGSPYVHNMTVTLQQLNGYFSGTGYFVPDPTYTWNVTGTVDGSNVSFHVLYTGTGAGYYVDATGTIDSAGQMSGDWSNASQSGTWSSTAGMATKLTMVTGGWSGLFTSTVPPFTFTTDASGAGSWHVNLKDADFLGISGTYPLSVWINEAGGTILISNNFDVVVD